MELLNDKLLFQSTQNVIAINILFFKIDFHFSFIDISLFSFYAVIFICPKFTKFLLTLTMAHKIRDPSKTSNTNDHDIDLN